MNDQVTEQDPSDPEVQARMRRNQKVAAEAKELIIKRHKKQGVETCFENTANTIGVLCSELILDSHALAGEPLANAMRDLLHHHIDRALFAVHASKDAQNPASPKKH
ncbi:hypothetical protein [Leisingera sp. M523]|uniref:hypothetical protein n=1 Tax=Leisingera sp. M523 TaxID=2867013 RepID=UPI0021A62F1F|nr:hypothetical protein [Leisingera sp. M523]UWQ30214.1 hypothetical protein K3557_06670 [Leisingera sp. M523]